MQKDCLMASADIPFVSRPALPSGARSFALLLLTGSLLSLAVLLSKLAATQSAPMIWYLAFAMGGSGAILTADAVRRGEAMGRWQAFVPYSLVAGALMALGSMLGYVSVGRVGASFVSVAIAFPTLLTYLLALAFGLEGLRANRVAGVLAGLVGGLWLALAKGGQMPVSDLPAIAAASAMPVVLAVGNVFRSRYWPKGAQPRLLAGLMLLSGAAISLPVAYLYDGPASVAQLWQGTTLPLVLGVAVLSFVAQYLAFFRLQQLAGPVYLSQIGSVAAIVGSLVAFTVLGEAVFAGFLPAAICIALGLMFFQLPRKA